LERRAIRFRAERRTSRRSCPRSSGNDVASARERECPLHHARAQR
jgi:hypothetical protein